MVASQLPEQSNPMRKIFFLVGLAIVVFLAVTTFSVRKSMQGSAQLSAIKDLYFPVLERVDANIVRLDKMEEQYVQSVIVGERELLAQAGEFYTQADKVFLEMGLLYPVRDKDIATLRLQFKRYNELAAKTSLRLLNKIKSGSDLEQGVLLNKALAEARQGLKAFRQSSYDNFVQTLVGSQQVAQLNLIIGIALGVMNLLFMGVLVFFIRNNMRMMSIIAEQNATLEHRVAERTAQLNQKTNDIHAMLHNMKLGVCTVVPGNRIHPEYSEYLRTIFGIDDLADKDLLESLFGKSTLGVDTKDQIAVALSAIVGEDAMIFDFNSHLLVREMEIRGEDGLNKIIQMEWSAIINEELNIVEKVLLIAQDVTHLRKLELAAAHQKEELDIISRIIKVSVGKFNDFVGSAQKFIGENRQLIQQTKHRDPEIIAALFRNMHTIKGNARTYDFTEITNAAHVAEQNYDQLRKDDHSEWISDQLLSEVHEVEIAVARYIEVSEDKLGRKGRASDLLTTRGVFVGNEVIAHLKSMANALTKHNVDADVVQLHEVIQQLGLIPLQRIISGSVDSLSSLAKELNKPTPAVEIINGDIACSSDFAEALKSSFMHIVRNSMDHGIERPEERLRENKPEQGQLRFVCKNNDSRMELHISDDGRGLALHKLYEKGISNGLFTSEQLPSPEEVAELIFHSGVSTSASVTRVSGRGVGMDAVRTFLKQQGSDIHIKLNQSITEFGYVPFTFIISLPSSSSH